MKVVKVNTVVVGYGGSEGAERAIDDASTKIAHHSTIDVLVIH